MDKEQRPTSRGRRSGGTGARISAPPAPPPVPLVTPLSRSSGPQKASKVSYVLQRDYRVLEREKRVSTILNNENFRAELESILKAQNDGSAQPKKTNLQKLQDISLSREPKTVGAHTHGSVGEAVIPINDLRGVSASKYTIAQRQTRCRLASVYRLVEMFGWSQLIYNHITALCPSDGENAILINAFGLMYHEVTASNLVLVDLSGNVIDPGSTQLGVNEPGFSLHSAIHVARSDVKCVIHVHTNAGIAISSMNCGLLSISEEANSLGGVSYHDGNQVSQDEQREKLAQDLGPTNMVLVLRNHGLVAMGRSIEEAFHVAHKLVKACEIQVALMSIGVANILQSPEGVWSKGKPRLSCFGGVGGVTTFISVGSIPREWGPGELEFEALMRMLDNKGYNTGYRYKGLSLLEPDTGKSGTWKSQDKETRKKEPGRLGREKTTLAGDSSDPSSSKTEGRWNFLDQRKIDRTEPVIKPKVKGGVKRHKDGSPNSRRRNGNQETHPTIARLSTLQRHTLDKDISRDSNSMDSTLSPLARAEQAARRVAVSTGEAVQRLANESSGYRRVTQSHSNKQTSPSSADTSPFSMQHDTELVSGAAEAFPLSGIHRPASLDNIHHLSPLQMAQYTAEKVALSTGKAVRTLTLDFTSKSLQTNHGAEQSNTHLPAYLQNGELGNRLLKTNSEPSLVDGRTPTHPFTMVHHSSNKNNRDHLSSLVNSFAHHPTSGNQTHLHDGSVDSDSEDMDYDPPTLNTSLPSSHMSRPVRGGGEGLDLLSLHRPSDTDFPEGYSPLEKVTHTAERVSNSTGVAVLKLSGSLSSQ